MIVADPGNHGLKLQIAVAVVVLAIAAFQFLTGWHP